MSNISFIARRKVPFLHNPVANHALVSAAVSGIQRLRATKEIGDVYTQTDHLQKVDSQFLWLLAVEHKGNWEST